MRTDESKKKENGKEHNDVHQIHIDCLRSFAKLARKKKEKKKKKRKEKKRKVKKEKKRKEKKRKCDNKTRKD